MPKCGSSPAGKMSRRSLGLTLSLCSIIRTPSSAVKPAPTRAPIPATSPPSLRPPEDGTIQFELWTVVARDSQIFLLRVRTDEESWPTVATQANAFTDSFTLETPMPFGVSREDSLFQYWGEIVGIDPAKSRRGAGDIVGAIFSGTGEAGHRSAGSCRHRREMGSVIRRDRLYVHPAR